MRPQQEISLKSRERRLRRAFLDPTVFLNFVDPASEQVEFKFKRGDAILGSLELPP